MFYDRILLIIMYLFNYSTLSGDSVISGFDYQHSSKYLLSSAEKQKSGVWKKILS